MKVKILIVDDEILQLNLIGAIIRRYRPDYEVVTTHQPMEALKMLRTRAFNALMTDVKMPQMNGIELIRQARAMHIEPLEIIILSGFDDFQYARSAISFEVREYLLKPIHGDSLQQALRKLEEKLEADDQQRRLKSVFTSRQRAMALYKKASGLMVSEQEENAIRSFGDRIRMILIEDCADAAAWMKAMPSSTCVEQLSEKRFLAFAAVPWGTLGEAIPAPAEGTMAVSSPCTLEDMPQRWRELKLHLDTARRMKLRLVVQSTTDCALLDGFSQAIREQDVRAVNAMAAPLRMAVQGGRLTLSALSETAKGEIAALVNESRLLHVYPQRQSDLLKVLTEEMDRCDTPEALCEKIAEALTAPSDEASGGFEHNVRIYIDAHYGTACSLHEISQAFHYSTAHFSRLFSAEFGATYTRWLADYRLEKARELLMRTTLSVREIAKQVGIGDAGYLIRQFSKKYAMPPEKYRRRGGKI